MHSLKIRPFGVDWGIGPIDQILPAADLVARFKREHAQAREALLVG